MDNNAPKLCKQCQGSVFAKGRTGQTGRPPMFCCYECKEAWVSDTAKAATVERLAGFHCVTCGEPFKRKSGKAINCSPKCSIRYQNKRKRSITPNRYALMFVQQDGKCGICRTDKPGGKGDFHVDHCHATGTIRGLLCHGCNVSLGHFKDDPALLRAAAEYLERTM